MPIKGSPSIQLRRSFLHDLPRRVPPWLKDPVQVLFLDPTDATPSATVSWSDAQEALGRHLAERTTAFVYFDTDRKDGRQSILEVSESAHASSYGVTLPDASYNLGSSAILDVMVELHRWLALNKRGTFIVGGNELLAGWDWATEENDVARALEEPLVEWLCCAKSKASPHLDELEVVRELDDVTICRRGS
jgi:hypothetical protein